MATKGLHPSGRSSKANWRARRRSSLASRECKPARTQHNQVQQGQQASDRPPATQGDQQQAVTGRQIGSKQRRPHLGWGVVQASSLLGHSSKALRPLAWLLAQAQPLQAALARRCQMPPANT